MQKVIFLSLLGLGLIGCQNHYANQDNSESKTISYNKEVTIKVLKSLETGAPSAIQTYINPNKYIQHNLAFPSGRDVILGALPALKEAGTKIDIKRVIADGNLVATHSDSFFFGDKAGFDVYRFENGKIVEHWDNLQNKVEKTASGRSMTDGATEITDLNKTNENKQLVKSFVETILMRGEIDKISNFISSEKYYQHNPNISDGLSGLSSALESRAKQGVKIGYSTIHKVIGEGNFVLTMSEGISKGKNTSFYDLFRVENNKIVEHWDTLEEIPAKSEWKNQNGKF